MRFVLRQFKIVFLVGVLCGCVATTPFVKLKPKYEGVPRDALYAVALEIETAVQEGNRDVSMGDREGIVVSSETVRQAVRTRAVRSVLVRAFREAEYGAEKRDGFLYILRKTKYKKATTRREKNRDALLVMSENDDRWAIYEGIQKASKLPVRTLSAIQRIFYDARVEVMEDGHLFENEAGDIVSKGS